MCGACLYFRILAPSAPLKAAKWSLLAQIHDPLGIGRITMPWPILTWDFTSHTLEVCPM